MKFLPSFIASCISESGMNYLTMRTQLQTAWKYISPAIRNSVSVLMTILPLWKHLKTELFLSQWSYWINLSVYGKVIIFLDISRKCTRYTKCTKSLTFILATVWVLRKSGSFQEVQRERTKQFRVWHCSIGVQSWLKTDRASWTGSDGTEVVTDTGEDTKLVRSRHRQQCWTGHRHADNKSLRNIQMLESSSWHCID